MSVLALSPGPLGEGGRGGLSVCAVVMVTLTRDGGGGGGMTLRVSVCVPLSW